MDELIGKRLGLYEVETRLGTGGMANVYKAYQPSVGRYVAIKVLPRQDSREYQIFSTRFMQEAQLVARLEHPHILPVYDFGETNQYLYLVMRLVQAGTLWDRFHGQPFPLDEVQHIIIQIGDALDYAHSRGIIHRDIKPKNILMDGRNNALLTDFGIAKDLQTNLRLTLRGTTLGTPTYMSPEQIQGQPLDGRSDIYALGVILFQLTTGRLPFDGETPHAISNQHLYAHLPSVKSLNSELPQAVDEVVAKAMAKRPDDRYRTAGELVQAVRNIKLRESFYPPQFQNRIGGQVTEPIPAAELEERLTLELDHAVEPDSETANLSMATDSPAASDSSAELKIPAGLTKSLSQESSKNGVAKDVDAQAESSSLGDPSNPNLFSAQRIWQGRELILAGGIGLVTMILLASLIGFNLMGLGEPAASGPATVVSGEPGTSPADRTGDAGGSTLTREINLVVSDDFSEPRLETSNGFDANGVQRRYEAGAYVISVQPGPVIVDEAEPVLRKNLTYVDKAIYEDFVIEVELLELSPISGLSPDGEAENSYGVTFRDQGRSYYSLEIRPSGDLRLTKVIADEEAFTFNEQATALDPDQPTRLRLEAVGSVFTVYVNDDVYNFTDPAEEYLKQGELGFLVRPASGQTASVAFDNLKIWSMVSN
ncbi:MAG TPA: serine/threonine-protein kinase [Anaerolineae bacterium]|nr:serine/threonine-protein kinase [Anaerolineae bacterium]